MKKKNIVFSLVAFSMAGLLAIPAIFDSTKVTESRAGEEGVSADAPSTQEHEYVPMDNESLSSYFGMPVCEVTINSGGISANIEGVLDGTEINNPNYVYHVKMAEGLSSANRFPHTTYKLDNNERPVYNIILDNLNVVSGSWSSAVFYTNNHLNETIEVNWYIEGTNIVKGYNWNAVVCRDGGSAKMTLSTINSGSLAVSDSYNNCVPFDDRGCLDLIFDENVDVTSASNIDTSYDDILNPSQQSEILLSAFTKKNFNVSLVKKPGTGAFPLNGVSTEYCLSGEHIFGDIQYNWEGPYDEYEGDNPYDGCSAVRVCEICGKKEFQKATLSVFSTATCGNAGEKICRAEFKTFPYSEQVLGEEPATGEHIYVHHDLQFSTCVSIGFYEHYTCETCDKYFIGDSKIETTYSNVVMPISDNHDLVHHDAVPNCDHDGNIEYWQCSLCEKYFVPLGEDLEEISAEEVFLPADPSQHDMLFFSGSEPTCETPGLKDYYICSKCNNYYFVSEDGAFIKTTYDDLAIPALGHINSEPTYNWIQDTSGCYQCVASMDCLRESCDGGTTEYGSISCNYITQPSFDSEGLIVYTATFENSAFVEQTKEIAIPKLNKDDYMVNYNWSFDGETPTCVGIAINKEDSSIQFSEEASITSKETLAPGCTTDGEETLTATFTIGVFETQTTTHAIPPHDHHMAWTYDKYPTANTDGLKHWGCIYCDYREGADEVVPALNPEDPAAQQEAKDSAFDTIKPVSEEDKEVVEEALEKIPVETIFEITAVTNTAQNDLAEQLSSGDITQEVFEERVEIVQSITKSAVVVGADHEEAVEAGAAITESIPEDTGLDMGSIFDEFYARQMSYLLGEDTPDTVTRKVKRAGGATTPNYNIPASDYEKIPEFVETSVEHMTEAVMDLRECSGEKLKQDVKNYITKVQYSSFRDFDKEAADNEFVENAYNAIMLNMQSQVVASLQSELDELTANKLASDPAREKLLNEQIEAVNDMEQFEIMVLEVLRQKYVSLTSEEITLEDFEPIYRGIFRAWALDEESGVDITLKQLTEAVIDTSSAKTHFEVSTNITKSEIILFATLGGAIVLAGVGFAIYGIVSKKRRAR